MSLIQITLLPRGPTTPPPRGAPHSLETSARAYVVQPQHIQDFITSVTSTEEMLSARLLTALQLSALPQPLRNTQKFSPLIILSIAPEL
jgi:hypothetical protein